MKKRLLLFSAAILMGGNLCAQVQKDTASTVKVRVYSPTTTTKGTDNSYRWAVKTDLLGFVTGEFPIVGEYRFSKNFSVEASAGLTYAFLGNDLSVLTSDEEEDAFDAKPAMGSAFRGTIKFYPSSDYDAIEGWAFGIQVFSKTMNREYESQDDSYPGLNGKKDTKVKTGISLIISKQIFQDSNIAFESFIGIGFANSTREYYGSTYDDVSGSGIEKLKTEKSAPNFQLGFRIGFGN